MSQVEAGQGRHVDGDDDDGDLGDVAPYQLVVSQIEAAWHVGDDDDGVGNDGDDTHQLVVSQIEAGQGGDVDGAGGQGGEHVVAEVDLEVIHGHEDDGIVGDGEDFTRHNFDILNKYVQDDGDDVGIVGADGRGDIVNIHLCQRYC